MSSQTLFMLGASIFGLLGTLHLAYTFFTRRFDTRNAATAEAMRRDHPVLTRRTTVWNAWIGFNASHSLGVMLFAALYGLLAARHMPVLRESPLLAWLSVAGGLAYLALAWRYWFRTPLIGIAVGTACLALGALLL